MALGTQGGQEAHITGGLQQTFSILAPDMWISWGTSPPSLCSGLGHLSEGALPSHKEQAGDPDEAGGPGIKKVKHTPVPSNSQLSCVLRASLLSFLWLSLSPQHSCPFCVPATQRLSRKSLCCLK